MLVSSANSNKNEHSTVLDAGYKHSKEFK